MTNTERSSMVRMNVYDDLLANIQKIIKQDIGIDLFPQPTDDEASNGKGLDILAEEGLL